MISNNRQLVAVNNSVRTGSWWSGLTWSWCPRVQQIIDIRRRRSGLAVIRNNAHNFCQLHVYLSTSNYGAPRVPRSSKKSTSFTKIGLHFLPIKRLLRKLTSEDRKCFFWFGGSAFYFQKVDLFAGGVISCRRSIFSADGVSLSVWRKRFCLEKVYSVFKQYRTFSSPQFNFRLKNGFSELSEFGELC